jgi:predicted methyltransferase
MMTRQPIVVSHFQVEPLLAARRRGDKLVLTSLDLGLSQTEVHLEADRVVFPDGQWLPWATIDEIAANGTACFLVADNTASKIQAYSEEFGRFYSLMPTATAPTVLISGILMHRIKKVDPIEDTRWKIRAIAPITDRVLDTATGLGYTAIAAAKTADQVVTIELDPTVQDLARLNPWSRDLFENPKIERLYGDAFDVIQNFPENAFARIIHDPPTFTLAGHLYSTEFYRRLYRVLKRGGRLFHYIGDPQSPSGRRTTQGVIRRLQEAGFAQVSSYLPANGVIVRK